MYFLNITLKFCIRSNNDQEALFKYLHHRHNHQLHVQCTCIPLNHTYMAATLTPFRSTAISLHLGLNWKTLIFSDRDNTLDSLALFRSPPPPAAVSPYSQQTVCRVCVHNANHAWCTPTHMSAPSHSFRHDQTFMGKQS